MKNYKYETAIEYLMTILAARSASAVAEALGAHRTSTTGWKKSGIPVAAVEKAVRIATERNFAAIRAAGYTEDAETLLRRFGSGNIFRSVAKKKEEQLELIRAGVGLSILKSGADGSKIEPLFPPIRITAADIASAVGITSASIETYRSRDPERVAAIYGAVADGLRVQAAIRAFKSIGDVGMLEQEGMS